VSDLTDTPRLWGQMTGERDLYLPTWRDIADFVVPWRGRYLRNRKANSPNEGRELGQDIVDSIASQALRTLASGMMSSLTNPARPWFRITTADPTLAEIGAVRAYLFQVERLVQWVFARSNVHNELHTCYRDLGSFGTSPLHIDEDDDDVIRAYVLPAGQYALGCNSRQRVDSMGRTFFYTVRQLAQRFGKDRLCRATTKLLQRGELNQWREVLHLVLPNDDFQFGAFGVRGMRWRSVWLEVAADEDEGLLSVGGYRQFPTAAARWELTGTEDVYGHSPVREILPDIRQLQHIETQKITLIDKAVAPPTQGPPGVDPPSLLAGAFSELPASVSAGAKHEPIWQPDYQAIREARGSVQELEMRVRIGLHEDLWRLMATRDQEQRPSGMTATEVATRHEEALTQLGPVVDRVHNELLSPLIRRTISILADKNLLPPPPRELAEALARGEDVRIEYSSVLAQAQKLLGLGAVERFVSIANVLSGGDPNHPVWDKVDRDEIVDLSSDMLGIPPSAVRPDDEVAEMRIARSRQQQQAAQMQAAQMQAQTTKDLGTTPMGQDSALSRLLAEYGPQAQSTQVNVPGAIA
jgi:hypothetical protein